MEKLGGFWMVFSLFRNILQLNHAPFQSFKLEALLERRDFSLQCQKEWNISQRLPGLFLLWIWAIQCKRKFRETEPDTACAIPFLSINRRTPFPALKSKHLSRTSHQQANYTLCNRLQFLSPLFWCVYRSERYLSVLSDGWAFAFVTNFQFSYGHV